MRGQTFLSSLAGVVVGAVLVIGGQRFTSARQSDETPEHTSPTETSESPKVAHTTIQFVTPPPSTAASSARSSPQANANPPAEQLPTEEETAENFQKLIDDHDADPKDPGWAPTTESSLTDGLDLIGEKAGFDVMAVDCRTSSCTARLKWDDYGAAHQGYQKVLVGDMEPDCTRSILVRHSDGEGPYETTAFFDCTDSR